MDTIPVTFEVMDWHPVRRKGVYAFAAVRLNLAGVEILAQGFRVMDDGLRWRIEWPRYRHADGRWLPALILPNELRDAVADQLLNLCGQADRGARNA